MTDGGLEKKLPPRCILGKAGGMTAAKRSKAEIRRSGTFPDYTHTYSHSLSHVLAEYVSAES